MHKLVKLYDFAQYSKEHGNRMSSMQVLVQLDIKNNGSHFSEEKFSVAILYILLQIMFLTLAYVNWQKYKED